MRLLITWLLRQRSSAPKNNLFTLSLAICKSMRCSPRLNIPFCSRSEFSNHSFHLLFKFCQTDWRKLTEFEDLHQNNRPNLLEVLVEWSSMDNTTFLEYLGLRALPALLKLDGLVLGEMAAFTDLVATGPATTELSSALADMSLAQQQRLLAQYAAHASLAESSFKDEAKEEGADATVLNIGQLDLFPVDLSISVGRNPLFWPVISEAIVQLKAFQRGHLTGELHDLLRALKDDYVGQAWSELYKIIGDIDLLASPVQNSRKLWRGLREFVMLPVERYNLHLFLSLTSPVSSSTILLALYYLDLLAGSSRSSSTPSTYSSHS